MEVSVSLQTCRVTKEEMHDWKEITQIQFLLDSRLLPSLILPPQRERGDKLSVSPGKIAQAF